MEFPRREKTKKDYKFVEKGDIKLSTTNLYKKLGNIKLGKFSLIEESVILRGDLNNIRFGGNVILCENSILHPGLSQANKPYDYKNIDIGSYCFIGKNCIISSPSIGDHVYIGDNCILSDRTIIENNVKILDNTYVPTDSKLLSNGIYGGYPAQLLGMVNEDFPKYIEYLCNDYYEKLVIIK